MKPIYVYPGSFCPPTYGHVSIVVKSAELLPEVIILCSNNQDKSDRWFSEDECAEMWNAYSLPPNVRIITFSQFIREDISGESIVMIRGIRNESDLDEEKKVALFNKTHFNIDKFFYIFGDKETEDISSSRARQSAVDLDFMELALCVAPLVVTRLLEKVLQAKEVFMVVGPPGAGKSTLLQSLDTPLLRHSALDAESSNQK